MNDIITLPQDIENDREAVSTYTVSRHVSRKEVVKHKILLTQNLVVLLMSGEKVLHYSDKTARLNDGQFAVLTSGNCLMTEKFPAGSEYRSILFFFDGGAMSEFFLKYANLVDACNTGASGPTEPFAVFDKDEFIRNYADSLDAITNAEFAVSQSMKQLKFEELMLYLLEKHPDTLLSLRPSGAGEYSDFEIRKAVEQNVTRNVTVGELAFLCNMSESTFKRKFRQLYGNSPNRYLLARRMEIAASLLIDKRMSSGDVSLEIGYESPSGFSQSFKRLYGVSPGEYRDSNLAVRK